MFEEANKKEETNKKVETKKLVAMQMKVRFAGLKLEKKANSNAKKHLEMLNLVMMD